MASYMREKDMDFAEFKKNVSLILSINLDGYKEKQLKRRLDNFIRIKGFGSYGEFFSEFRISREMQEEFLDKLTINVSEFYRNAEVFRILEKEIIPGIARNKGKIRVWSAGCSVGAEAYSVAMIMEDLGIRSYEIYGTDIDRDSLRSAEQGSYRKNQIRNLDRQRVARYFHEENGFYRFDERIKQKVNFSRHDLLLDQYGGGYDIILCRNVVIYFTREKQTDIYRKFHDALCPGGVLFIGATESIFEYRELGFRKEDTWFYCREEEVV